MERTCCYCSKDFQRNLCNLAYPFCAALISTLRSDVRGAPLIPATDADTPLAHIHIRLCRNDDVHVAEMETVPLIAGKK